MGGVRQLSYFTDQNLMLDTLLVAPADEASGVLGLGIGCILFLD